MSFYEADYTTKLREMRRQQAMTHRAHPLTTLAGIVCACALFLSGCTFQPLYGNSVNESASQTGYALSAIAVDEVDTRVAQQVRNHLIFLLTGGEQTVDSRYVARLRVRDTNNTFAPTRNQRDDTAGSVTVTVSYDLIETATNTQIGTGSRNATASYDRTSQNFANDRSVRDAENRAAREVAELLRLAFAADLGS